MGKNIARNKKATDMKRITDKDAAHRRLLQARELLMRKGLIHTDTEFADRSQLTRSHLSAALNGDHKWIIPKIFKAIASTFPDIISEEYLLEGIGQIERPDPSLRPHIPVQVAAGRVDVAIESAMNADMMPQIPFIASYDFTIPVIGASMEPLISEGDILACLWCEEGTVPHPGTLYVFDTTEGILVKQAIVKSHSIVVLHSLNPAYDDIPLHPRQIKRMARVIASLKKF